MFTITELLVTPGTVNQFGCQPVWTCQADGAFEDEPCYCSRPGNGHVFADNTGCQHGSSGTSGERYSSSGGSTERGNVIGVHGAVTELKAVECHVVLSKRVLHHGNCTAS